MEKTNLASKGIVTLSMVLNHWFKAINIFLENYSPVSEDLQFSVKKLGDRVSDPEYSNIIRLISLLAPYHRNKSHHSPLFLKGTIKLIPIFWFEAFLGEYSNTKSCAPFVFLKKLSTIDYMAKIPDSIFVCNIVDEMISMANQKDLFEYIMNGLGQDDSDDNLFFVNCLGRYAEASQVDLTRMELLLPEIILVYY